MRDTDTVENERDAMCKFSLCGAASDAHVGIMQTLAVTVMNGLFTAVLNSGDEFDNTTLTGEACCPARSGNYIMLNPQVLS
jgi:hypothetical protein